MYSLSITPGLGGQLGSVFDSLHFLGQTPIFYMYDVQNKTSVLSSKRVSLVRLSVDLTLNVGSVSVEQGKDGVDGIPGAPVSRAVT